jgi:hypothetical protein
LSNYLAFATVSATIGMIVAEAMHAVSQSIPTVTYGPPAEPEMGTGSAGANIFMYQIMPNAALRNQDLPLRNAAGQVVQQPSQAFDLYYLITFFGNESKLEPQRLMGAALNGLELHSVLSREAIYQTITSDTYGYLQASNLYNQIDHISLESITLTIEEIARLWTTFTSVKYRLSVYYKVSVVILDPVVSVPEALIATMVKATLVPPRPQPKLKALEPLLLPYRSPATLTLQVENINPSHTAVYFGSNFSLPTSFQEGRLQVNLPPGLVPGTLLVWIAEMSEVGLEHPLTVCSNRQEFVLQPAIEAIQYYRAADPRHPLKEVQPSSALRPVVSVRLAPNVGYLQPLKLLLNEVSQSRRSLTSSDRSYGLATVLRFPITDPKVKMDLLTNVYKNSPVPPDLRKAFAEGIELSAGARITSQKASAQFKRWVIQNAVYHRLDQTRTGIEVYLNLAVDTRKGKPIEKQVADKALPGEPAAFTLPLSWAGNLKEGLVPAALIQAFKSNGCYLSPTAHIVLARPFQRWVICDDTYDRVDEVTGGYVVYARLTLSSPEKPDQPQPNLATEDKTIEKFAGMELDPFSFILPANLIDDLNKDKITSALQAAFRANGYLLSAMARITPVPEPEPAKPELTTDWIIRDNNDIYRINRVGDDFVVYFMLPEDQPEERVAFDVSHVSPGTYLVRVQVDDSSQAESLLQRSRAGFYNGPTVTIG